MPHLPLTALTAAGLLALLLSLGRRLEPALQLERLGVPAALLAGLAGLLLGPYGPAPLLPASITAFWVQLPTPLLTLVFATLMLGRPLPGGRGLIRPVAIQALMGLLLGFGQYLMGGLVVLLVLIPRLGVDPLMACLIEVGFEGGHGTAVELCLVAGEGRLIDRRRDGRIGTRAQETCEATADEIGRVVLEEDTRDVDP